MTKAFVEPFQSVLVFFLLEMGVIAASPRREVKTAIPFMAVFGVFVSLLFGTLEAILGMRSKVIT